MTSFSCPFSCSSTPQSYYDLHSQISEYWVIWFWTTSDFRKATFVQLKSFNQLLTLDPTQKKDAENNLLKLIHSKGWVVAMLTYCNRTSFSWCVIRTPPRLWHQLEIWDPLGKTSSVTATRTRSPKTFLFLYILADLISFLEIQRLQLTGSSSTVFAVNLILY